MIRYKKLNENHAWRGSDKNLELLLKDVDGDKAKITIKRDSEGIYRVVLWMSYENEYGRLRLEEEESRDDIEDIESAKAYAEELIKEFDLSEK